MKNIKKTPNYTPVNLKARYVLMNIITYSLITMIACWLCIGISGLAMKANQTWHLVGGIFYVINMIADSIAIGCMIALLVNCISMCHEIQFSYKRLIITAALYIPLMLGAHIGITIWELMWTNMSWVLAIFGFASCGIVIYVLVYNFKLSFKTKKALNKK